MADLPIGMQLEKVQSYLRKELRSCTTEEIQAATGVDIDADEQIGYSLSSEASKVMLEKDGRWRWKSAHYLLNRHDLFALLGRSFDGVLERELLESYKGVDVHLKQLKKQGLVYQVGSGVRTVLYPRDARLELEVAEDVRERYNAVRLPDEFEVQRYLVDHGLKDADKAGAASVVQPVTRKRPKRQPVRKKRRTKLTNTHMAGSGIDLNTEYRPADGKGSAFL